MTLNVLKPYLDRIKITKNNHFITINEKLQKHKQIEQKYKIHFVTIK